MGKVVDNVVGGIPDNNGYLRKIGGVVAGKNWSGSKSGVGGIVDDVYKGHAVGRPSSGGGDEMRAGIDPPSFPDKPGTTTRQDKIKRVMGQRHEGIIVLEDIHDPHNAAAVWRSCDAFGFGKVYLIFGQEERFDPKQVGKESSSSANKWLDFEVFASTEECFKKLK